MDDSILSEVKPAETNTFLQQTQALVAGYAANSKAANTWKSYQADLGRFCDMVQEICSSILARNAGSGRGLYGTALQSLDDRAALGH